MSVSRLMAQLDGARMVRYDSNADLILAWQGAGSTGIHVYAPDGTEVSYWQVEAGSNTERLERDISESMGEHMTQGYYPN